MSTKAIPRHAGSSYRLTFRCSERRYFLTPTPEMKENMGFCLARAANRFGIQLHAFEFMSNHVHLDLTDVGAPTDPGDRPVRLGPAEAPDEDIEITANLSHFLCYFKSLLARSGNCFLGRWEYFWAPGYGCQEVLTADAASEGIVYTICNAVRAGLVASAKAWPGLVTTPKQLAVSDPVEFATYNKPKWFFRTAADGGSIPDQVTLTLYPHPLGAEDPAGFIRRIKQGVKTVELKKRAEMRKAGRRFRGAAAILAQHWNWSPKTKAPRRKLSPRVADPDPLMRELQIAYNKWFESHYGEAMEQWLETGQAVFPAGTNKMRAMPGVTVEPSSSRPRLATLVSLPMLS